MSQARVAQMVEASDLGSEGWEFESLHGHELDNPFGDGNPHPAGIPGAHVCHLSHIAQLVERRIVNPQVPGSSPGVGAVAIAHRLEHPLVARGS